MAVFDAPTRALRCGFELGQAAQDLGVEIRAGLHTGEIERREAGIGGIAVHIAARLLSSASPGSVVVTRTSKAFGLPGMFGMEKFDQGELPKPTRCGCSSLPKAEEAGSRVASIDIDPP